MSGKLWKRKASSPSKEDVIRETSIKDFLSRNLGESVRCLQQHHVNTDNPVRSGEMADQVCNLLEAIFMHGLKDTFFDKVSAILSSIPDKPPQPNFWPFLLVFSHKDVISQINNLSQITTDIGRCRAWIRNALNDSLLESYLGAMIMDQSSLEYYYKSTAYLCDSEQSDIMRKYIEGLCVLHFKLARNSHILNSWGPSPLAFSGIWSFPLSPEPVVTGIDVAYYLEDDGAFKNSKKLQGKEITVFENPKTELVFDRPDSLPIDVKNFVRDEDGKECSSQGSYPDPPPPTPPELKQFSVLTLKNPSRESEKLPPMDLGGESVGGVSDWTRDANLAKDIEEKLLEAAIGENQSANDATADEDDLTVGNSLTGKLGWSSPMEDRPMNTSIEEDPTSSTINTPAASESYKAFLYDYNKGQNTIIRTPNFNEMFDSLATQLLDPKTREEEKETQSVDDLDSIAEFEIIPKNCFVTKQNDERTQILINNLTKICPEVGLDAQGYQCKGCSRPIGMIYGKARVCVYDGCYYCFECHENEESLIPSRVLHNWDLKKYKVAKHTKLFLQQIEDEPLIDIHESNPQLYSIVDNLAELLTLRTQLGYLRAYLFTCRESVAEDLRKRIWPREYLYEHVHCYSLSDLIQAFNGALAHTLRQIVNFATKHVLSCRLCNQKGFICEICDDPKVIFPFEMESTYRCNRCLAVYHAACMNSNRPCPKCERKFKRKIDVDYSRDVEER